ncbi:amidohydrolase family protein [Polymorphobacter fuscus]|uniref:Amidohydrolase family protein n=1 Tax=Sandarakinorhabdus fusca TaxID=1439888 RepID=A0A7C9GP28_9SPHN|nr:amidohydrolase family protein [Polymorphobacter fuscus]KAB7647902.1 amidohydrolase family protein [Polymorphobacter fuscus]MQT17217.1 amidohydrolase family protein [Polymorphobacter fuscus]NJC08789.1 imidazolonepropionase-like amidohydrolase [Polymorphobacter fuscus]
MSGRPMLAMLLAAAAVLAAPQARAKDVVIHAGTMIDGTAAQPRRQVSIIIKDERIVGVQNGFVSPAGAEVIDLSAKTVLPGFIDVHDHISMGPDWSVLGRFTHNESDAVITAMRNARRDIEQGFTAVRDCGSGAIEAPALIRAIAAKQIIGPRIWSAMEPLSATGGHSDPQNGMRPEIHFEGRELSVIDGAETARKMVRQHHRDGAKLIKIMPSGGVGSIGDDPNHMTMTDDEMRAVTETAHEIGLKVAAHVHGNKAINHAVEAGVDSIDHGTYADATSYKLMKQHGTYLVPTLLVADWIYQTATKTPEKLPPTVAEKAIAVTPTMIGNAGRAYKAGVKIALGTDFTGLGDRNKAEEFALLVKAGLTPMDAILAGTRNAADLIGVPQDIGSIQPGRYADIVAVDGDPLADIAVLQRVGFVMKGGDVLKRDGVMQRMN